MDTAYLDLRSHNATGVMVSKDFDALNAQPTRQELWDSHLSVFKVNLHQMHTTIRTYLTLKDGIVVWSARVWRDDFAAWKGYGATPEQATLDALYCVNRDNS